MKLNWLWIVLGVLLAAIGLVWTLQGLNVLRGSAMSGSMMWGIIGPIVLVVGIGLVIWASLRGRRKT